MIAPGMPMFASSIDKAARTAIAKQAERRSQIAMEAGVELLVEAVGVKETIKRLRAEIDHLTEFGR